MAYDPSNAYNNVQDATGAFVAPRFGVGYGGQGAWLNKHFATQAEAETFFDSQVTHLREVYAGNKVTRRNLESEAISGRLIRQFRIVNIKADGKPGKLRQTVQLYTISE